MKWVWERKARFTPGGLERKDLKLNKDGKPVSRAASAAGKRAYERNLKMPDVGVDYELTTDERKTLKKMQKSDNPWIAFVGDVGLGLVGRSDRHIPMSPQLLKRAKSLKARHYRP